MLPVTKGHKDQFPLLTHKLKCQICKLFLIKVKVYFIFELDKVSHFYCPL